MTTSPTSSNSTVQIPKLKSMTTGRTTSTATEASTTGTEPFDLDILTSFKGQDVEVTYRATHNHPRTLIGKVVGVAQRDRTGNPPDLVLANRSPKLILVNTTKITRVRSTMEIENMWEMNPMELARIGYEAFIDRAGVEALPWADVPHKEKEIWMATSEAVRDAVRQGA